MFCTRCWAHTLLGEVELVFILTKAISWVHVLYKVLGAGHLHTGHLPLFGRLVNKMHLIIGDLDSVGERKQVYGITCSHILKGQVDQILQDCDTDSLHTQKSSSHCHYLIKCDCVIKENLVGLFFPSSVKF